MGDFGRKVRCADVSRVNPDIPREREVRVYCVQSGPDSAWCLQVRAPLKTANGREGKDFMVASANYLSREDMMAIRDAINAELAQ